MSDSSLEETAVTISHLILDTKHYRIDAYVSLNVTKIDHIWELKVCWKIQSEDPFIHTISASKVSIFRGDHILPASCGMNCSPLYSITFPL